MNNASVYNFLDKVLSLFSQVGKLAQIRQKNIGDKDIYFPNNFFVSTVPHS